MHTSDEEDSGHYDSAAYDSGEEYAPSEAPESDSGGEDGPAKHARPAKRTEDELQARIEQKAAEAVGRKASSAVLTNHDVVTRLKSEFTVTACHYTEFVEAHATRYQKTHNILFTNKQRSKAVPYGLHYTDKDILLAKGKLIRVRCSGEAALAMITKKGPIATAIDEVFSPSFMTGAQGEVHSETRNGKVTVKPFELCFVIMDIEPSDQPNAPHCWNLTVIPYVAAIPNFMREDMFQDLAQNHFADWHQDGDFFITTFWEQLSALLGISSFQMIIPTGPVISEAEIHTGAMKQVYDKIKCNEISFQVEYVPIHFVRVDVIQMGKTRDCSKVSPTAIIMQAVLSMGSKGRDMRNLLRESIKVYQGNLTKLSEKAKLVVLYGEEALNQLEGVPWSSLNKEMFYAKLDELARLHCIRDEESGGGGQGKHKHKLYVMRSPVNRFKTLVKAHFQGIAGALDLQPLGHAENLVTDVYDAAVTTYYDCALAVYKHIFHAEFDAFKHSEYVPSWPVADMIAIINHLRSYDAYIDPESIRDKGKNGAKYFEMLSESGYSPHVNLHTFVHCRRGHSPAVRQFYIDNGLMPEKAFRVVVFKQEPWIEETGLLSKENRLALARRIENQAAAPPPPPQHAEAQLVPRALREILESELKVTESSRRAVSRVAPEAAKPKPVEEPKPKPVEEPMPVEQAEPVQQEEAVDKQADVPAEGGRAADDSPGKGTPNRKGGTRRKFTNKLPKWQKSELARKRREEKQRAKPDA